MAKAAPTHYQLGDKFWEVWIEATDLYTRHGKAGSLGQVKVRSYASASEAKAAMAKAIESKQHAGFCRLDGITAQSMAAEKGGSKKSSNDDGDVVTVEVPDGTTRLELESKFWQVHRKEGTVTLQFGKRGTDGATQVKKYRDAFTAREEVSKLLREKQQKGYRQVLTGKQAPPSPVASNRALEKAIYAQPDDDGFMVYADWLQQQGDHRGELAALQAQLAKNPKQKKLHTAERGLLWEQRAHFYGPLAPYVAEEEAPRTAIVATWRQGWLDTLTLAATSSYDQGPSVEQVDLLVRLLPEVASAKFLRELVIAKPGTSSKFDFSAAIDALAGALPSLPLLKRITIGKFTADDSELSWSKLGKLDALWPAAKQVEYLKLRAGSMMLGKIDAPNLRELRIETGGLAKQSVAAIVAGKLPKLETLNLWFGQPNYGCDCQMKDLLPLLDKKHLPKVKHLGIANTTWGDELCKHWPSSKILAQLETLDLSRSHLTVSGMKLLAAHADAFAHLTSLDLHECLLDKPAVKLAKTLCATVNVESQDDADEYQPPEEDDTNDWYRYTAVGE
jgi:uncharacterized protein (TIGR02996 family)